MTAPSLERKQLCVQTRPLLRAKESFDFFTDHYTNEGQEAAEPIATF